MTRPPFELPPAWMDSQRNRPPQLAALARDDPQHTSGGAWPHRSRLVNRRAIGRGPSDRAVREAAPVAPADLLSRRVAPDRRCARGRGRRGQQACAAGLPLMSKHRCAAGDGLGRQAPSPSARQKRRGGAPRHLNTALRTKMPMPMSKSSTRMRNRAMIMTKPPYWRVAERSSASWPSSSSKPWALARSRRPA
jgi:hypothetical protein